MKNLLNITIITLTILSCKAQSPIVGLDASYNTPEGAYYKDLDNELDKFIGTWKFTNNSSEFIFVLQKKVQIQISNDYYDILNGEYSYEENGIEIVNTLPIDANSDGNIGGSTIRDDNNFLSCIECTPNERRVKLYFNDPEREYLNVNIVLRYLEGSNPPQMTATVYARHGAILPTENSPTETRVPYGEYLMVKQ
ncbi:hypothetical protein ES676_14450 [Bizionia saleffrena]|uniref:DUF6705 domain-containing protein n=1 Tax=Bizionia saleffrena TaxID=291189 RepID=A0A8H2QDF4_9FLAO|nr:DUF6705 family protein [Bizionia saleffrena]TYB69041.1 hypothetical protein ES676_14450 [Bizionia saleffrena]